MEAVRRFFDGDVFYSFKHSPLTIVAAVVILIYIVSTVFAVYVAPHNPFDLKTLNLLDAFTPPNFTGRGNPEYFLGTDDQGRDVLSAIIFGSRMSLVIGLCATLLAMALGVTLGLISGYAGGKVDAFIMRVADVQLSFPAILIALLIDGLARVALPKNLHDELAVYVLILSIGLSFWVQYARTVRGSTMVERGKEYVQAARVIGRHPLAIMLRHVLPNVMGPVLVIATINLALAIITEATLSFLGVGVPPPQPAWGLMLSDGKQSLMVGRWWLTVFPGCCIMLMVLSANILGDWLRVKLDPQLRQL